jgi:hypothetical protein
MTTAASAVAPTVIPTLIAMPVANAALTTSHIRPRFIAVRVALASRVRDGDITRLSAGTWADFVTVTCSLANMHRKALAQQETYAASAGSGVCFSRKCRSVPNSYMRPDAAQYIPSTK